MTSLRIKNLAKDLDARRIQNYIKQNRFKWSLENFDKNLAALEATLAKLKTNDYKFYE